MPPAPLRSIGQVLALLRPEFPDVSISKIRFLEGEGLVSPERAPSGYRRYAQPDIDRLRYILRVQRDHYLPLKVIRDHLEMMDRGVEPPSIEAPLPVAPTEEATPQPANGATASSGNNRSIKLTRRELLQVSGVAEATLIELERQQMVALRRGSIYYGREALTLCVVARKLQGYGLDTRHLRAIKQSAEREVGLIEQAVQPYRRQPNASQVSGELMQLVVHAHSALLYTLLDR